MNAKLTLELLYRAGMCCLPKIAVVTGSGIQHSFPVAAEVPYAHIKGMPVPGIHGHLGKLQQVDVSNTPVLIFCGRAHLYEGGSVQDTGAAVSLMAQMGITHLILTNAVGSLRPKFKTADIVLATDVIPPIPNPFHSIRGKGASAVFAIDSEWRQRTLQQALTSGIALQQGTYVQVLGPQYETRAEIRMYRRMGADVIGMSTATEALIAWDYGIKTQILSLVTNMLSDVATPTISHAHVIEKAQQAAQTVASVITSSIFAACS